MIIKIQQSLSSSDKESYYLLYNKSKTILYEDLITDEIREILGERPKAYFEAKVVNTIVQIGKEVKEQQW